MPPRPIPVPTSIAKSDVQSSHMDRDLEKNTQQLKITTVVSSREHIMPFDDVICLTQRKKIYDEFDSHLQTNTIQVGRVRYVFNATARCGEQVVLDDLSSSQRAVFPRSRNKLLTMWNDNMICNEVDAIRFKQTRFKLQDEVLCKKLTKDHST